MRSRLMFLIGTLVLLALGFNSHLTSKSNSAVQATGDPGQEAFYQQIRTGGAAEITLAAPGASLAEIKTSVDSVARLIETRSGQVLDPVGQQRLIQLEDQFLNGSLAGKSVDQLARIQIETVFERIGRAQDTEIEQAADSLLGFRSADLPAGVRRATIRPRASAVSQQSPQQFVEKVKALRHPQAQSLAKAFVIQSYLDNLVLRIHTLQEAAPNLFQLGITSGSRSLSPVQSVLLTYSLAADDPLARSSEAGLNAAMQQVQSQWIQRVGSYPTPVGQKAYGPNGYLYSSPINFLFEPQTFGRLLDRLQ